MTDGAAVSIRALQAEGRIDPIGVRTDRPRLAWKIVGDTAETAFRVIGSSSLERLHRRRGDVFDITTTALSAAWPGPDLVSRERVWWAVGVGEVWSQPAVLEAPLWRDEEWGGSAITHQEWVMPGPVAPAALPHLRTTFSVTERVTSARLYLTGAGVIVPFLNGQRAIDAELEPGYSDLRVSTPASAWDVTDLVQVGDNSIEVLLGGGIAYLPASGRYTKFERTGEPVWAQVRLEVLHLGGNVTVVVSDEAWKSRLGPITVSHWYGGESHVDGHGTEWENAVAVPVSTSARWRGAPPIRVVDVLRPRAVHRQGTRSIVDFGVNAAGRPRLRLEAARPHEPIVLTPGELLRDGRVDQSTTGTPIWDSYTPDRPRTSWAPLGVYHGARYLEVAGSRETEPEFSVEFEVLRTDNQPVGSFSSSDPFLARLHQIIDRAVQSNMFSVFTDCPHREKLGWLEQLHYCFQVLARGYDVQAHLEDMVRHMLEAQTPEGLIPNIAPELVVFDSLAVKGDIEAFRSDPNWGRAIIDVPWMLYRHYGDIRIVREALPAMARYLDYLDARASDGILDFGLGDWIEVDSSTPRDMVATHGWASMLDTMARCSAAAGDLDASLAWRAKADRVWTAFRDTFWNESDDTWGSGSQGSWSLAWSARHADEGILTQIGRGLIDAIHGAGGTLTVGEISLPHLIRALTETGHADLLNDLIRSRHSPGYGHQIAQGATSLAESWQGTDGEAGVASQNHFMLGVIDEWLTGDVAGLRQAEDSVGWQKIVVKPIVLAGVDAASTRFDSPQGHMSVSWRRDEGGTVIVAVDLPAHVAADIILPEGAVLFADARLGNERGIR